ncbi:MAG: UDP-N-acetylmuramoyl-tripeptide--D-alanyl-D-alanine ligase [Ruminococcaceae bacterium]|nr:UDP-N-acetylmuramoyl-tripeptide--D-alanyl-D-alanine ligase [Oscillospiraceae bacterium]
MSIELKLTAFSAEEIAEHTSGRVEVYGTGASQPVTAVGHDSRDVHPGMLFCAIVGERFDGNDFICDVIAGGCDTVLCSRVPDNVKRGYDFTAIVVEDTVTALGALASYYRSLSGAKVIAVTGSVGKTTTKEFIYSVASAGFRTHKTKGNYNNEIGLPLTLFELAPEDQVSVIEMGMSDLGEIERMSLIAKPDIAVITNIGTSHLANLGSRENICRAKLEIMAGLSEDGCILMNGDEPLLFEKKDDIGDRAEYFSVHNRYAEYRAVNVRTGDSIVYDLIFDDKAITNVDVPTLGRHNVYNSLVAYSVGVKLGMTDERIRFGLSSFAGAEKRQNIYRIGDITVIDDCYNASPESMKAAIDVLVSLAAKEGGSPAALLGDMLELGEYCRLMHDQLGRYAAQEKVQKLFCFGEMADVIAEAAITHGIRAENVFVCVDIDDPGMMADMIRKAIDPGDVLLVKASRGVRAERVLDELKRKLSKKKK